MRRWFDDKFPFLLDVLPAFAVKVLICSLPVLVYLVMRWGGWLGEGWQ